MPEGCPYDPSVGRGKPRNQLVEETGLSEKQVRLALEKLKAKSLVETSQHRFGGSVGPVMHYRLLPRAMGLLEGARRVDPETPVSGTDAQHLDHMAEIVTDNSYVTPKGVPPELSVSEAGSGLGVSGKDCEGVKVGQVLPKKTVLNAGAKSPNPKLGMSAAEIIATKSKTGLYPGQKAKKGPLSLKGIWSKPAA